MSEEKLGSSLVSLPTGIVLQCLNTVRVHQQDWAQQVMNQGQGPSKGPSLEQKSVKTETGLETRLWSGSEVHP